MSRRPVPPYKIERFLEGLATLLTVQEAARYAGVSFRAMYDRRLRDPMFADRWREAIEQSVDRLEDVAFDRAVHGVVRQRFFKGVAIEGSEYREYSNSLLIFLLKTRAPARFREHYAGKQTVTTHIDCAAEILAARKRACMQTPLADSSANNDSEGREDRSIWHPLNPI